MSEPIALCLSGDKNSAMAFQEIQGHGKYCDDLPDEVDPCGENGEFHAFVSDGPTFSRSIEFAHGEIVERDGFFFDDLLPEATLKTI